MLQIAVGSIFRRLIVVACIVWACAGVVTMQSANATTSSCSALESAARFAQRQVQIAESGLIRAQNDYYNGQNRTEARIAQYQLRVAQADANRQAMNGISAGNAAGCAVRSVFRIGWNGCYSGAVSSSITRAARANASYQMAVNQLNSYITYSANYLSRLNQRVVMAQAKYDAAQAKSKEVDLAYIKCVANNGGLPKA